MINDPKNLVRICSSCHRRATNEQDFADQLRAIFYDWKKANLDLFLRAQATIESIEKGQSWDYMTPQMIDAVLKLATAQYAHLNERLTVLEQTQAQYFGARLHEDKITKSRLEMEWNVTEEGQEMIMVARKIKVLEKVMSSQKASLRRLEIERFNER